MWRLSATLRERKHSTEVLKKSLQSSLTTATKRYQHDVAFQLDYYMSPQFAGVASALVNNSYQDKGLDLSFLPTCPVGLEQERVRNHQNDNSNGITMGSVEQNIFIPTLAKNPTLKTTAVAAMYHKSPLCIASLPGVHQADGNNSEKKMIIGVHEDTVDLMRRVFPEHEVVASPRATKNTDLLSGKYDAIQAYTTTEVPTLRLGLGADPVVTMLEGCNGNTRLGYGQVMFTADECLEGDQREVVKAFCEATFEGWSYAIRHPEEAVEHVREARKMLGLDDENNDHWHPSDEFELEMLQRCNDHAKSTFEGDRYGVIDASRWREASEWLLGGEGDVDATFGLDKELWQPQNYSN